MKCPVCDNVDNFRVIESRDFLHRREGQNYEGFCERYRLECLECNQRITTFMIRDNDLLNISFMKKIYIMFGRDEINNLKDLLKELSIVAKFKNKIFEINKSLDKFSEKIKKLEEDPPST